MPLQPCRRHGKKRKEDEPDVTSNKKDIKNASEKIVEVNRPPLYQDPSRAQLRDSQLSLEMATMLEGMDAQLQSSQVSSTVLDSPVSMYQSWNYQHEQQWSRAGWLDQRKNNWMNPWSEYGPFGGLEREVKVDPDSTSLDESRPKSTISQEDYRPSSRNVPNVNGESPRGSYTHSPRGHSFSPRGSLPNTPGESIYSTPPRTCPSTPQDQRLISPRSSGYSSAPSDFNLSSPSPRQYQNSLENRQNSISPRANYQNPPLNFESPQRNTPSRGSQHTSTPIGPEVRRNQSPSVNQLRSPNLNLHEQNQRYPSNTNQYNSEIHDPKSPFLPKPQTPYESYPGQNSRVADYVNHTSTVPGHTHSDYLTQSPLHVQSLTNQNYDQLNENDANTADQKRNSNNPRGVPNNNYPPVSSEQSSNWSSLSSWGNETNRKPVQSPLQNLQQSSFSKCEYGNSSKMPSWETSAEPPSPFRVPKGRPPSRTTPNHNAPSETSNSQSSVPKTFLKPQEPSKNNTFDPQNNSGKISTTGQNHQRKPEWPQDKLREGNLSFLFIFQFNFKNYTILFFVM